MSHTFTCFDGFHRIAHGTLAEVALPFQRALRRAAMGPVLLFYDDSGRTIDIDTRGSEQELLARVSAADHADHADRGAQSGRSRSDAQADPASAGPKPTAGEPRGRGRPKLGVVGREVTLLPRHWDWLSAQPGGASVALRKLVELARRSDRDDSRRRHERAYQFMSALAGDLPGFEEAIRALFANDRARFEEQVGGWPEDARQHAAWLAFAGSDQSDVSSAARTAPVERADGGQLP